MVASAQSGSPSVVIVGAGFGGLGVAIALRRAGFRDVLVLERAERIGGVWRDNTYPGAACDVPSPLYSWSFRQNPDWRRRYSPQPDILDYIRAVADEESLGDCVRTGVEVTSAVYDDAARRWTIGTRAGETLTADILVPALGQLSEPVIPAIEGAEDFAGPAFHSARWRHDVDLAGKRVAVIGTGASAIQFVPGIVDQVASMSVFQRSAPYVVPKPDQAYGARHREWFARLPELLGLERRLTFRLTEVVNSVLLANGARASAVDRLFRLRLRRQVRDPELRRRLTPDYPIGCKRVLFSNDWYPAITRPHVEVVTERVRRIEPGGVRDQAGLLHPADVLIWGTGFAATGFMAGIDVHGTGGRSLAETWADGAFAHLGMTVPGFPNLFLIYGPNTNLGGSSIIGMLEAQAAYVVQAARLVASGRSLDVRPERAAAYDREMQSRLAASVWAQCSSWYADGSGRIATNWPGLVREYLDRTAVLAPADFRITHGPAAVG